MFFSWVRGLFLLPFTLFANPIIWTSTNHDTLSVMTNAALSMQQLQSLIPERIWEQDFAVIVHAEAYQKVLPKWMEKHSKDLFDTPCSVLGESRFYFVRNTLSGDGVRILDRFEDFQYSPFWKLPEKMHALDELEKKELLP